MTTAFPAPQVLQRGGTIRWAVGDPAGLRSHTWSVISHRNTDDVYIGLRSQMDILKLSLHRDTWRMAFTDRTAQQIGLPPNLDRVLDRWMPTREIRPGWRRAVTIAIPYTSLQPGWPEPPSKHGTVAFLPPPQGAHEVRFDVLLGAADAPALTITGAVAIGHITLPSGGLLGVAAHELPVRLPYAEKLARLQAEMQEMIARANYQRRKGWAWGRLDDDGPVLIDMGLVDGDDVRPAHGEDR